MTYLGDLLSRMRVSLFSASTVAAPFRVRSCAALRRMVRRAAQAEACGYRKHDSLGWERIKVRGI
jgi:hypothetical protein